MSGSDILKNPFGEAEKEFGSDFEEIDLGSEVGAFDPFAESPKETSAHIVESQKVDMKAGEEMSEPGAALQVQQPAEHENEMSKEDNPILAAIEAQEEKTITSIFSMLPVFSYGNATEEIEDTAQTFDEFRKAKAVDFPELDEAGSVSWSVTYGKIVKTVEKPAKTKIGDFKSEIETSKEFKDALKKSKEKSPKCVIKPQIRMQKKGISAYKGFFLCPEDARNSDKVICFIPSRNGHVYEMRKTDAGEFITKAGNITDFAEVRAGFKPALPLIPHSLFEQITAFFRSLMFMPNGRPAVEALAQIYWDKAEKRFFVNIPEQRVTKYSVDAVLGDEALFDTDKYIRYADVHSHNDMAAKFSKTDDADEKANLIYIVVGRLNGHYPEITARIANGGKFLDIPTETILQPLPLSGTYFPPEWLHRVHPAYKDDNRKELIGT